MLYNLVSYWSNLVDAIALHDWLLMWCCHAVMLGPPQIQFSVLRWIELKWKNFQLCIFKFYSLVDTNYLCNYNQNINLIIIIVEIIVHVRQHWNYVIMQLIVLQRVHNDHFSNYLMNVLILLQQFDATRKKNVGNFFL